MNRQEMPPSAPIQPSINKAGPTVREIPDGVGRPSVRFSLAAWVLSPGRAADLMALALAGSLGLVLATIPVGSGDYGQWLMLSRYYLGASVPDYREVWSVPPLMPASLAAIRAFIPDPLIALQVFKGILGAAFVLSIYLAGAAVFRFRAAGVLAAVFAFLVTDRLLEGFAFGGLPQLSTMVFTSLSIAAFGQASNGTGLRLRWWILGSISVILAAISHTGTGTLAMVVGLAVAVTSLLRTRDLTWRQRGIALTPLAVSLAGLAAYWTLIVLPANIGYTQNSASLAYRGPGRVLDILSAYPPNTILLAVGALVMGAGCVYEVVRRKPGPHLIVGVWAFSVWAIFAFTALSMVATDYPRFIPALVAPLALAAGGGLAILAAQVAGPLRQPFRTWAGTGLPLVLAVAIALSFGPRAVAQHEQEASFYKVQSMTDLERMAQWLDSQLPEGALILTAPREGKWIEGLTGRAALFSIPERYSFREVERSRSVAAETLIRSTASLTNEFFFIKYVDQKAAPSGNVPREPWIALNHGGEYLDTIRVLSPEASIASRDSEGGMLASLSSLEAVFAQTQQDERLVSLSTSWQGPRQGGMVSYQRTLSLGRNSNTFDFFDEVNTGLPVNEFQIQLKPVPGMQLASVEWSDNSVVLSFPRTGTSEPRLRVSAVDQDVKFERSEDGILVKATQATRLHLQFTALTAGNPLFQPGIFFPEQLVKSYNVGAVVLQEGDALESRLTRLSALGFTPEKQLGPYVALIRRAPVPDRTATSAQATTPISSSEAESAE